MDTNAMRTVACLISTYGADEWRRRAEQRAVPSAQGFDEVIHFHDEHGTLASVRNTAAEMAMSDWLVFLDGDDELSPGYADTIRALALTSDGLDVFAPRVQYVVGSRRQPPKEWPRVPLVDGNWIVIGAALTTNLFHKVGGFREWTLYEDWDLWQRCELAGARFHQTGTAVYVAHVQRSSRNRSPTHAERLRIHHEIRRANYPHLYEEQP